MLGSVHSVAIIFYRFKDGLLHVELTACSIPSHALEVDWVAVIRLAVSWTARATRLEVAIAGINL